MTAEALAEIRVRAVSWLSRQPDHVWNPPRSMAVWAVVIAVLAYALVAWNSRYPNIALDEIVMIANSRAIAGLPAWEVQGWGFMPGLAIFLAPVWWFSDDPVMVYRAGIAISAVFGVAAILPFSALARRAGATPTAAIVIASTAAVAPAHLLLSNYLFSELLVVLVTAYVFVAAARLVEHPTLARAIVLGSLTGAALLAQWRGAFLVIAVGLWGISVLARLGRYVVVAGVVALISCASAYSLYLWVTERIIANDPRVGSTFAGAVERDPIDVVASVIGQGWYAVTAWVGLTVVGAIWCTRRFVRDPLSRLIVIASASSFVLSTIGLNARFGISSSDTWYYGRYNDQMWIVLAVVGMAVLVRLRWPLISITTVGVSALAALLMLTVTVPRIGVVGGRWSEFNTFGVSPWLDSDLYSADQPQAWVWVCLGGVILTTIAVAVAWWRDLVVPALFVFWTVAALWHDMTFLDVFEERAASLPSDTGLWETLPDGTQVGVATDLLSAGNLFVFYSSPHPLGPVDLDAVPDDIPVVLAKSTATAPAEDGAMVLDLWRGLYVAWVYPGEVFDTLDSQGLLIDPAEAFSYVPAEP